MLKIEEKMEITYKKDYVGEGALCYNVYFNEELVDEAMGIYFDNNLNKYCVWIAYFFKNQDWVDEDRFFDTKERMEAYFIFAYKYYLRHMYVIIEDVSIKEIYD